MFGEFIALVDDFDTVVGARDVIAETDFEILPAKLKGSIVEMLRTLAENGPNWAPEQFVEAKNRAISSVEAVREAARRKRLGIGPDRVHPCPVALRGKRATLLGRCGRHASEHIVFRVLAILDDEEYAKTTNAATCFHCAGDFPLEEETGVQCFTCGRMAPSATRKSPHSRLLFQRKISSTVEAPSR
eukprot:4845746-Pyramimonas_sp.AAC.1